MDFGKLKNMSPEKMMENAQHIWQMLDDMAQNDPQGYRKFIDKQMTEGKEMNKPPEPHMCVQTKLTKPELDVLFINIFEWIRVPEPKSDDDPIPVMNGATYKGKDDTGVYTIVNVAFCPKILSEFGIHSSLTAERNMLINLAIDYLQDTQKMQISRNYTILQKIKYKGALKTAVHTLTHRLNKKDEEFNKNLGDLEKTFLGPMGAGVDKDSLLGQLSNITNQENADQTPEFVLDDPLTDSKQEISDDVRTTKEADSIKIPGSNADGVQPRSSLIQEIGVDEERVDKNKCENTSKSSAIPAPEYEMETTGGAVVVRISLPGVCSVKECELDISQKDVCLVVSEKYKLLLPLKCVINEDLARAKFNKKTSVLTLTLPL